jgi:hypothetical protein
VCITQLHIASQCINNLTESQFSTCQIATLVPSFHTNTSATADIPQKPRSWSLSVVYLVDDNNAEKRFESSRDLLNKQTIYQILGTHPRLLSTNHIGADFIIKDWMKNGDLARFIQWQYPVPFQ